MPDLNPCNFTNILSFVLFPFKYIHFSWEVEEKPLFVVTFFVDIFKYNACSLPILLLLDCLLFIVLNQIKYLHLKSNILYLSVCLSVSYIFTSLYGKPLKFTCDPFIGVKLLLHHSNYGIMVEVLKQGLCLLTHLK